MENLMSMLMDNMWLITTAIVVCFLVQGTSGHVRTLILSVLASGLVYFLTANPHWAMSVLIASGCLVGFDVVRQFRSGRI